MPALVSALARGRFWIVAAALLWSLSGAYVKSPVLTALPAADRGPVIAFYRALFAGLVLLPLLRAPRVRWRPLLVPMAISFAAMNVLFISAMTETSAANAILLQYTAPLWMFLGSVTLLGERLERRSLAALVLGMIGVAVILTAFLGGAEARGVLLGLAAGLAYGSVAVCLRMLRDEDPAFLIVVNHLASAAVLLPWIVAFSAVPGVPQLAVLALFGTTQMAVPYVLFARGLQTTSPQEAGALTLLEPVLNPIWVFLLWREPVAPATFLGGAFILAGLAVRYVPLRWLQSAARQRTEGPN